MVRLRGSAEPEFRMISREQQFAEKLHAYTRPRTDRDNSRVKDLVDLLLLMRTQMEPHHLHENIERTFAHRQPIQFRRNSHRRPNHGGPDCGVGGQCSIDGEIDSALRSVNEYVRTFESCRRTAA